jgi:MFS family permease
LTSTGTKANHVLSTYGYLIAAACFSIQAIGIGIYAAYGVFFNPLMSEFGWSRAVISGANSMSFFIMGLFGMVVGRLNDRFGPKTLTTVSAVFLGSGLMLTSQITAVWQLFLFYGVIYGMGLSVVDVIALTTIVRWFSHKRGLMTGIVKIGTGAGQFIFPLLASLLIAAHGWRTAFTIIGAGAMVVLVVIARFLRRDPGQLAGPQRAAPAPASRFQSMDPGIDLDKALRTVQLWIICLVNLSLLFCLIVIMIHIVPHARDMGLRPTQAAGMLSTIGGVSMVGRFLAGLAIDGMGSKRIMICAFFLLIGALLWLQTADTLWKLYLFAGAYGIAHGGFFTAISPLVAEVFGIRSHGALFGIVVFSGTIGGAIGPITAGYIFDITGNYTAAFWIITTVAAFGLGLIACLRPLAKNRT